MNPDTLRTIFQGVATVFVGGGLTQLLVHLLRRRGELRNLDASSGSAALNSANEYIETLQAGEKAMREELVRVNARIEAMQRQWDTEKEAMQQKWDDERRRLTEALDHERREVERMGAELARHRSDLAVAQAQIQDLSHQLTRRGGMV